MDKKVIIVLASAVILIIIVWLSSSNRSSKSYTESYLKIEKITDSVASIAEPIIYQPTSIIIDNDVLYAVDSKNQRILTMDKEFNLLNEFGKEGNGPGEFVKPYRIAFRHNMIFVSDYGANKIHVFTKNGRYLNSLKENIFMFTNFAVTIDTTILIGNPFGKNLINEYSLDGNLKNQFGRSSKNFIDNFCFITLDGEGNIFLSFCGSSVIQKYDKNYNKLWEIRYGYISEVKDKMQEVIDAGNKNPALKQSLQSLVMDAYLKDNKLYQIISTTDKLGIILVFDTSNGKLISKIKKPESEKKKYLTFTMAANADTFFFTDDLKNILIKASISE